MMLEAPATTAPLASHAAAATHEPLLRVRNLAMHFELKRETLRAVDGLSFNLDPGESLGLVGESGSGKSLTALSIIGLLPPPGRIVRGSIRFTGRELQTLSQKELRRIRGREIGMVFQDPMSSLNPTIRIGEQVAEPLRWHGVMSTRQADARALELLRFVGIPAPERRFWEYPFQFSGGMRQRVMIAMALACNPRLLIADEPTTALDVTVQMQVLQLIARMRAEQGTAVLLVSHDLGVVAEVCDRVAVMYAGRIVEQARIRDFMRGPAHPYAQKLLQSSPILGRRAEALDPIPGFPPNLRSMPSGCPFHPRCPLADARCSHEYPPDFQAGTGHTAACWRLEGAPRA